MGPSEGTLREEEEGELVSQFRKSIQEILQAHKTEITHRNNDNNPSHSSKSTRTIINGSKSEEAFSSAQIVEEAWTLFTANYSPSTNNNLKTNSAQSQRNHAAIRPSKVERKKELLPNDLKNGSTSNVRPSLSIGWRVFKVFLWILRMIFLIFRIIGALFLVIVFLYCVFTLHKPTQAFISRNTQDLIYPVMRALRLISIPLVERFPILTEYYEESCLISNPWYEVEELECWPCENVRHVLDLTGFSNFSSAYHNSGIPFIVKDAQTTEIGLKDIRNILEKNPDSIVGKAFVYTNYTGRVNLRKLFNPEYSTVLKAKDFHLKWYINRVVLARFWRKYFPRPYFIPATTEVSVQRYLYIDRPASKSYRLPLTEFANVFVTQASGSRSIVLIPTEHCQKECKVVSAILQPKDVLFYNWLFWRPLSVMSDPAMSSTSVTFIGSFY